jgi:hypothetical protein
LGALVQEEPIETELPDGVDKLRKIYRLANVAIGAEPVTSEEIPLLIGRSEDDHGKQLVCGASRIRRSTSSPSILGSFKSRMTIWGIMLTSRFA